MNTHFDWLIEEDQQWTPSIDTPFVPPRAVLCRACLALLAGLSIALLAAWIGARCRYRQAVARATSEIQGMLDLEAQVVASCDRRRFLGLQDPAAPHWVDHQAQRLDEHCARYGAVPAQRYASNPIGLPGRVQEVTLHGDLAWTQVVTGKGREQYVRFYRWTERGWVHAPPDPAFWGEPTAWQHGGLLVQATARDQPYGQVLTAHMWEVAQAVCGTLGCSDDLQLRVTFLPDAMGQLPRLSPNGLLLPSPWLTGFPAHGAVAPGSLDRLTYWSAYYAASVVLCSPGPGSLNPTQKAILAEYARFYTEGDFSGAPILRRIVERQGIDALPALLRSLPDARALSDVLPYWLSLSTGMPDTYYGVLVDIAQDPATHTCQETFGLLTREEEAQLIKWIDLNHGWSACTANRGTAYVERMRTRDGT